MTIADDPAARAEPDSSRQGEPDGFAGAAAGLAVLRRVGLPYLALTGLLLSVLVLRTRFPSVAWLAELGRSGLARWGMAAVLVPLAGLAGTGEIAVARQRAAQAPADPPQGPAWPRWRRWPAAPPRGEVLLVSHAARLPQAIAVTPITMLAAALAWPAGASDSLAAAPDICFALGGAAIVLAFPLLIAERMIAALPAVVLPEAAALRSLLLVPVLVWPLLGVLEIATGLGLPADWQPGRWLMLAVALVAAELAVRAVSRLFLPPPSPDAARAAVRSTVAEALAAGARSRGNLAEPIRAHLGIDFARSWALAYVRGALPVVAVLLLAFCWALSGVVVVNLDRRAVYERFGAPVAVLRPGAHLILPWPLGKPRWVEYGTLHEAPLGGVEATGMAERVAAEDLPPASVDRLWEQAHPAEVMLLLASEQAGQQSFQAVSLDLRVVWRAGMTDADAIRLAYRAADPQALVRNAAGRAAASFFATRTLDDVLGENRAAMAAGLRAAMQQRLDQFASGIEVVAVVIEAIHPPSGAADAYHAVQAAQITANSSIDHERGSAHGIASVARQSATETVNAARSAAAEQLGAARADGARFTADQAAAQVGGEAFALERYLVALTAALAKAPLTILDHRIDVGDTPVLDLRAAGAAPASTASGE